MPPRTRASIFVDWLQDIENAAGSGSGSSVVTFHPSMQGFVFMAGTQLPAQGTVPSRTIFLLLPQGWPS